MRQSFWERIRDWALLVALLTIAFIVMVTRNQGVVYSLQVLTLHTLAWTESQLSWVGNYVQALEDNDRLREANVYLSSEVARARDAMLENERLKQLLALRQEETFDLVAAQIIGKDLTKQQNYLLLNVGSRDGVQEDMAVIDDRGIVGRVLIAEERYSKVVSYLNTDFHVAARILPLQADGIVSWPGDRTDRLLLEHIVRTEAVEKGQLVVTSPASMFFPSGLTIGTIDSIATRPGRNDLQVYVTPAAPIQTLQYVYVVLQLAEHDALGVGEEGP